MRRARPIAAGGARRLCAADILTRRTVMAVNTIRERNSAMAPRVSPRNGSQTRDFKGCTAPRIAKSDPQARYGFFVCARTGQDLPLVDEGTKHERDDCGECNVSAARCVPSGVEE